MYSASAHANTSNKELFKNTFFSALIKKSKLLINMHSCGYNCASIVYREFYKVAVLCTCSQNSSRVMTCKINPHLRINIADDISECNFIDLSLESLEISFHLLIDSRALPS